MPAAQFLKAFDYVVDINANPPIGHSRPATLIQPLLQAVGLDSDSQTLATGAFAAGVDTPRNTRDRAKASLQMTL